MSRNSQSDNVRCITCVNHAERSHSHRGFSPVLRLFLTSLEPFLTVCHDPPMKTVKTVPFVTPHPEHRAEAAVLMRSLRVSTANFDSCEHNPSRLLRLKYADVESADDVCNQQQHKRHCRRIAKIRKAKRRAIDVKAERFRCESRSAFS
jgi:hypothetical protein